MAKKYYVVWAGRKTGVFSAWNEAKAQIDKFQGAKYKSFLSKAEAEAAFKDDFNNHIGGGKGAGAPSSSAKKTASAKALLPVDVEIFCDGACQGNPGPAGTGVAVYRAGEIKQLYYGLYNKQGTNNTAELNGLFQSLLIAQEAIEKNQSVRIQSDSMYSINAITNWAYGWKAKGWKKKTGDIANLDIIKPTHALYDEIKNEVEVVHVSAHVGIEGNELADRMAVYAIKKKEPVLALYGEAIVVSDILAMGDDAVVR